MKRVCLVDIDMAITGGVEHVTASLANALSDKFKVYIYEVKHTGIPAYSLEEQVHFVPGLSGIERLREMISATFTRFIKFIKEEKIDVILMMGNYPALVVTPTRFFTKARYIFCDHGGLMNEWHLKDIRAIRYWDSKIAHKTIVLTEKTKKDYLDKFHINPKKIDCIYNWIEDEVVESARPYETESKKIISVGRFGKEKGYDMLLEVAKKVLPSHSDWQWHVYGTGETFDEISKQVTECGLDKQLLLKGNVDKVYRFYSEYAFLVLPSYREGLPLVLLEAAAVGLPMVSFDIETGPNEIIVEGRNGYLIPPYQIDKMAECISFLMEHKEKRSELSDFKDIRDKFKMQKILEQWIQLINS